MASPNVFANPFSSLGPTLASYTGNYFSGSVRFVSSTASAASDANAGTERELPKATWTSAYAASGVGDVIIVEASHQETIAGAGALGTAFVTTIGLGSGTTRPRFTSAVAGAMWSVSVAGVTFANLYFPASTAATTARIISSGTETYVRDCYFECGTNDTTATLSFSGNNPYVRGCSFVATASRPARALRVTSAVTGMRLEDLLFDGGAFGWANPALSVEAAVTRAYTEKVRLANYSDVVWTTTGTTYALLGIYPIDNTGGRISIAA